MTINQSINQSINQDTRDSNEAHFLQTMANTFAVPDRVLALVSVPAPAPAPVPAVVAAAAAAAADAASAYRVSPWPLQPVFYYNPSPKCSHGAH